MAITTEFCKSEVGDFHARIGGDKHKIRKWHKT